MVRKTAAKKTGLEASATAIIPARMASTRLPGKPLLDLCGKPIIQWVYEQAAMAGCFDTILVATPDEEIGYEVEDFGGKVVFTSLEHQSGTDRLAEVCGKVEVGDVIVNIQGDEPLVDPAAIAALTKIMFDDPSLKMASVMCPLEDDEDPNDPNLVKVVVDKDGYALYFSRFPIPYIRNVEDRPRFHGHVGIYAYRTDFLVEFAAMPQTMLEKAESLEQLRALENGYRIKMMEIASRPIGVDTTEDLARVRALISARGEK